MALTEETVQDKIEILEDGTMQVRTATVIKRDGVEISRSYHRHVVTPICDVSDESQRVQDISSVIHTPACKAAYKAKQEINQ